MNIEVQIALLEKRKREIELDYEADDNRLQGLLAEGRKIAKIVDAKKEKAQHLEFAITNLRALHDIEVEEAVPEEDPWGDD
jgi:hypothetical protein